MCIHKYQKCQERGCYQLHAVFYKCYISNRTRQKQSYPVFLNCLYVRLYKNCNGTIETIIQLSLFVILLLHLYSLRHGMQDTLNPACQILYPVFIQEYWCPQRSRGWIKDSACNQDIFLTFLLAIHIRYCLITALPAFKIYHASFRLCGFRA